MNEQIKLPEELLLEIQALKDELTENVIRIGRLSVQRSFYEKDLKMLSAELDSLYDKAESISGREDDLQARVVNEYGNGKLDFESGIFTKA
jgi:uncharacterized coiled-coil DUF342 family protein